MPVIVPTIPVDYDLENDNPNKGDDDAEHDNIDHGDDCACYRPHDACRLRFGE